jgi:hypothetical protein
MLRPISRVAIVHRLAGVFSEAATPQTRQIATDKRRRQKKKRLVSPDKEETISLSIPRPQLAIKNLDLDALLLVLTISRAIGLLFISVQLGRLWHVAAPSPCLSPAAPCTRPRHN